MPPILDGALNEVQWQAAPAVLDFAQFDPAEGAVPTEITSVRILYDDDALYVGVICYDSRPQEIVKQLTRRDRSSEADRFTVLIDSYHDHQTAFVFSTNVSAVQSDGVISQDGLVYDVTWDAVWSVQTRTYMDGWSAEFAIPYSALRFSPQEGSTYEWGINFRRYISRKRETIEWVMVPRTERVQVSKWGQVVGIRDIKPPLHLNITGYAVGSSLFETETPARPNRSDLTGTGGLDMKYGLTRNFTLDATINPDFGQVEVDQAVLNLTVFETRFPEKRAFFIEGAQLFTFGSGMDNTSLPLFFSRRIGKRPSLSPFISAPPGGSIKKNPQTTTILGAAKVSGRSESGFSLGALTAVTDEESATVKDNTGNVTTVRTEPRGSYNVLRVKQEFDVNSWVGGIVTAAGRENMLPGLSAGVDWNLRLGEGAYAVDGFISGTRPSVFSEKREGGASRLVFSTLSSEHWFYTTAYEAYSPGFNSNDLGFFAQPHDHGGYVQVLYRENYAEGLLRRYGIALNPEYRWNWDGVLTNAVVQLNADFELSNYWFAGFFYAHKLMAHDDAERGIIGLYRRPSSNELQLRLTTDARRDYTVDLTAGFEFDVQRKRSGFALLKVTMRPRPWLELVPVLYYRKVRNEEAWLFPDGNVLDPAVGSEPFSVFGDRDVEQQDLELRGIVTFTRNLSLQFFTQVFLARGRYINYKRLVSRTTLEPYDFVSSPSFVNHDFNEITFNANVLLRWEYLPGSAIYLVWTQQRFGDSGVYATRFGERVGDTFTLPHSDVLLLKVSYWLPL
jgi:hypothetical protein